MPVLKMSRKQDPAEGAQRRRLTIVLPGLILLIFIAIAFTTNYIPSASMEPGLVAGDHILTMRSWLAFPLGRMPRRGDIIIFHLPPVNGEDIEEPEPGDSSTDDNGGNDKSFLQNFRRDQSDLLIKRVIGLPGDKVRIRGNDVFVNGQKLKEDYPTTPVDLSMGPPDYPYASHRALKVPPGHLFVLGDNRNNSDDGRFWGTLKRSDVVGKYVRVLYNEGKDGPNKTPEQH